MLTSNANLRLNNPRRTAWLRSDANDSVFSGEIKRVTLSVRSAAGSKGRLKLDSGKARQLERLARRMVWT